MTERDDSLEWALRRTMAETASGLRPTADGLNRIRARIDGRPPRPYAVSVLAQAAERLRYWTWRGHWAWPEVLPRLTRPAAPAAAGWQGSSHARGGGGPEWGFTGLRLMAAFGAVAVVLGVSFGVQPFRHAIIQASSTMLNSVNGSQSNGAGTDGNGSKAGGNGGTAAPGASPTGTSAGGQGGSPGASGGALPGALAPAPGSTTCVPASSPSPTVTPTPASTATAVDDQDALAATCPAGTVATTAPADPPATYPDAYPTYTDGYSYDTASPSPTFSSPYWQRPGQPTPTDTASPTPTDTDTDTASPSPTDSSGDGSPSPTPTSSATGGGSGGGGGGGGGGNPGKPGKPGHPGH
jgi:hypothetical protein